MLVCKDSQKTPLVGIFLKGFAYHPIVIDAFPNFTVKDIKRTIERKTDIPGDTYRLIYGAELLEDEK
jgi:Ubiquitin family